MKKIYTLLSLVLVIASVNAQTFNRTLYWRGGQYFAEANFSQDANGNSIGNHYIWSDSHNWVDAAGNAATPSNSDELVIDGSSSGNNNVLVTFIYRSKISSRQYNKDLQITLSGISIRIKNGATFTIPSGSSLSLLPNTGNAYFVIDTKYGNSDLILEQAYTTTGDRGSSTYNTQLIVGETGTGRSASPIVKALNTGATATHSNTNPGLGNTVAYSNGAQTYSTNPNGPVYGGFISAAGAFLPVVLVDFNAVLKGSQVGLSWTTREEVNFSHFSIERSTDAVNWTAIGTVTATGNGAPITRYAFTDVQPASGINYYRMKMVDLDGKYGISPIKAVRVSSSEVKMSVYPNPAVGQVNILVNQSGSDAYTVNVFNRNGQLMLSRRANGSSNVLSLDISQLSAGTYFVSLQLADGSRQSRQLLVAAH